MKMKSKPDIGDLVCFQELMDGMKAPQLEFRNGTFVITGGSYQGQNGDVCMVVKTSPQLVYSNGTTSSNRDLVVVLLDEQLLLSHIDYLTPLQNF